MKQNRKYLTWAFACGLHLLLPELGQAFYSPSTGRWLSRDPSGEPGFEVLGFQDILPDTCVPSDLLALSGRRSHAEFPAELKAGIGSTWQRRVPFTPEATSYWFLRNQTPGLYDFLGLKGETDVGVTFQNCTPPLSGADLLRIMDGLSGAAERLDDVISGTRALPNGLTLQTAKCLRDKLRNFVFGCTTCDPVCWFADGAGVPNGAGVTICAGKIVKRDGKSAMSGILLLALHELVHTCSTFAGHGPPDDPDAWAAWLTAVLATPQPLP